MRRRALAVIGSGEPLSAEIEALSFELGRRAIDAGFRLATGGLGGVMEAASRGARAAAGYREGDVVGILPNYDKASANASVDIVIATGLGIARNVIVVASADVVVAVGGGSGTLSELAVAWQLGRPIVALAPAGGWAEKLAGEAIDDRRNDRLVRAESAEEAVALATGLTT